MKYILEPVYESYASKGSWGVRPGRSTWDVMMNIFFNLREPNTNYKKRILELDIEKCFDKINHDKFMNELHLPIQMQRIISSALKAGEIIISIVIYQRLIYRPLVNGFTNLLRKRIVN